MIGLRSGTEDLYVCAINVEEIWRGALGSEHEAIRGFLGGLRLAPLGSPEGERAGRWRRHYAERGLTLSQADCMIAAAAIGVGATLATGNPKHFPMGDEAGGELLIDYWPVG